MQSSITLVSVGDICFGDSAKCLGFGVKSQICKFGYQWPFKYVKEQLRGDIVFGNLECVLSEHGMIRNEFKSEQMRGAPDMILAIKDGGFSVLNMANNHSMQHGVIAFNETVDLLQKNGISVVGIKGNSDFFCSPLIKEVKGVKIGFLGYCFESDMFSDLGSVQYASNVRNVDIINDINKLTTLVDWVVVSVHWGLEYMDQPSPSTMLLGRSFIDAGANIVMGHHPHVIQGVERYKKGIICYSLGNFLFDMVWCRESCSSMIMSFELNKTNITYNIIPITIDDDFRPVPSSINYNEVMKRLKRKMSLSEECDYEKANLHYYRLYKIKRWRNTIISNIFMIKSLFVQTPVRFIPGKLRHIIRKFKLGIE